MQRIKLIKMSDAHTTLKAGDEGTIVRESIDQIGNQRFVRLDVRWDNGSNLAVYPHVDDFEMVSVSTSVNNENL